MNLLEDQWIPVKTRQGEEKFIAAYEIVQADIISLNAPRADFNAALIQFLIGLIQTVYAPDDEVNWEDLYEEPPTESQLKESFEKIKEAFYLDGDGYRFMQDNSIQQQDKLKPIEDIIFGAPGDSAKDKNKDHFVKQNDINGLCLPCAALAIMTTNTFADNGGSGYFESMRGNGFVSTLVHLNTFDDFSLWRNIWINILTIDHFHKNKNLDKFFWMFSIPDDNTRRKELSEKIKFLDDEIKNTTDKEKIKELKITQRSIQNSRKDITGIYQENANSLQVYWAWMRRLFLNISDSNNEICSVCNTHNVAVKGVYKTNKGYNYPKSDWKHPFSPYKKAVSGDYEGKFLALEMTTKGLPYIYWSHFTEQNESQYPALVITKHFKNDLFKKEQLTIWSFGYAMDKNSTLGWYESKTPLYLIANIDNKKLFESEVDKYIASSNKITDSYLVNSIKFAWFDENKEKNKDKKIAFSNDKATEISKSFWNNTESKFYELLEKLYHLVEQDELNDEKKINLRQEWYQHIKQATIDLFNYWAFKSSIQTNPKRISLAYNNLMKNLNSNALKHETLGLPQENKDE